MKAWANYHSHTKYCDGSEAPLKYIQEAIKRGLPCYGYSSHAPIPFKTDWCIADDQLHDYLSEIENIKAQNNKIEIYKGLEIDYIPEFSGRNKHILKDIELDYFISSVHFVDQFRDGSYWNIDTSYELFQKGLKEIFGGDIKKATIRFFELTRQMIQEEKPDIIGHIDKIKMFNATGKYFTESEKWYRDQIELTLGTLKNHNSIVEINTRGYYKYGQKELYPSEWIIRKFNAAGIPLMINSDSHEPFEITEGMEYAAERIKKMGVYSLFILYNNKWQDFPFSGKGLHI